MPHAAVPGAPHGQEHGARHISRSKRPASAVLGYNISNMRSMKRLAALLLCVLLVPCACARQTGEWDKPLSSENEKALDQFFLNWAYYTVQRPPAGADPSWDPLALRASRWPQGVQSSGDVAHAQVGVCPGTDLAATASLGYIVRVRVTCLEDQEDAESAAAGRSTFITACEACIYALGEYKFDGYDPQAGFLELLGALEEDSRDRREGKVPSASSEYNGCAMELTTDEEQTSLFFEIRHIPRKY